MVAVAGGRFTRASNCKALTGKILIFWIGGRLYYVSAQLKQVVAHHGCSTFYFILYQIVLVWTISGANCYYCNLKIFSMFFFLFLFLFFSMLCTLLKYLKVYSNAKKSLLLLLLLYPVCLPFLQKRSPCLHLGFWEELHISQAGQELLFRKTPSIAFSK